MKQISLFFLLIVSVSSVFSDEYFSSDKSGILLDKINIYKIAEYDYYVRVDLQQDFLRKTLYTRDGETVAEWEIEKSDGYTIKETVTDDTGTTVSVYDKDRLIEETVYENNEIKNRTVCSYDGNFLAEIKEYDKNNVLLSDTYFFRDINNRLQNVKFKTGEENMISHYRFSKGMLAEEWHGKDEINGVSVLYGRDGKILSLTNWEENKKIYKENFSYKNNFLSDSSVEYFDSGDIVFRNYDDSGNMIIEEEKHGEDIIRTSYYDYDADSNLVREINIESGIAEKLIYVYDKSDLKKEEHYHNGILTKIREYESKDKYYEDIYADDVFAARIFYLGNRKVSGEVWQNTDTDG